MVQGLVATIIEAPDALEGMEIPEDHLRVCKAANIPVAGNAAANTQDVFDLTGENAPVGPLPSGFTAKGYVAMVFSCIAAVLGMAVISWYVIIARFISIVSHTLSHTLIAKIRIHRYGALDLKKERKD